MLSIPIVWQLWASKGFQIFQGVIYETHRWTGQNSIKVSMWEYGLNVGKLF